MIRVKRVYDPASREDGFRILVDRLWPSGLGRDEAGIDLWLKEVAPSTRLRKWFGHQPDRWREFKRRYFLELKEKEEQVKIIEELERRHGVITLLYSARNPKYNNAVALKEYLESLRGRR